jgi:CHAD domain-containing protein
MPFEFDLTRSPQENIRNTLTERVNYILKQLGKSHQPDEAVHEARKTFKQIRALLRLIRPVISRQAYQEQNAFFAGLATRLAPLRDGFVVIETLDLIKAKFTDDDLLSLIAALRRQMAEKYDAERSAFIHGDAIQAVIQALQSYTIPENMLNFTSTGFETYHKGLQQTYRRARKGLKRVMRTNDALDYHEWRKSTKYLWHQIRLLVALAPLPLGEYAALLKDLSEELGAAHDLLVLEETLHNYPEMHTPGGQKFRQQLTMLRIEYERDTHAGGEARFEEKTKAFIRRIASYRQPPDQAFQQISIP